VALARVVSHEVERVLVLAITLSLVTLSLLPQDFWVVWVLAVVVVNLAFFGINQHFMRALQLNKLLWARLAIFVRMKSLCAISEGTLDLLSIGGALNTQNLVAADTSRKRTIARAIAIKRCVRPIDSIILPLNRPARTHTCP
jgi:hypothetical protein